MFTQSNTPIAPDSATMTDATSATKAKARKAVAKKPAAKKAAAKKVAAKKTASKKAATSNAEAAPKAPKAPARQKRKVVNSPLFLEKDAYKALIGGLMDQGLDHADAVETIKVGMRQANGIPVPMALLMSAGVGAAVAA
jgi:hypothetical protein